MIAVYCLSCNHVWLVLVLNLPAVCPCCQGKHISWRSADYVDVVLAASILFLRILYRLTGIAL